MTHDFFLAIGDDLVGFQQAGSVERCMSSLASDKVTAVVADLEDGHRWCDHVARWRGAALEGFLSLSLMYSF